MTKSIKSYWIYGKHSVIAALKNPQRSKIELILTSHTLKDIEDEIDISNSKLNFRITDLKEINLLLGKESVHQGIALKTQPLAGIGLNDLINTTKSKTTSLILALDQINDPHNLGAIMRTAAAFRIDGIIIPKNNSVTETPAVVKAASGAIDMLNICYISNLSQSLEKFQENNYWIIGLDGSEDVKSTLKDAENFEKVVLVLGSEAQGLRRLTKESCDILVKIPINTSVESLNVSNASAIAMYELKKNYCHKE